MKKLIAILLTAVLIISTLPFVITSASSETFDEKEDNNSFAAANELVLGNTVNGSITATDDFDYYKIEVASPGKVTLKMSSYMRFYCLYVYDEDVNQVWYTDNNEWNSTAGVIIKTHELYLETGTYYLQVNAYKKGTSDKSTGEYTLATSFEAIKTTNTESDNSFNTATPIDIDERMFGQISENDNFDYYVFSVEDSGLLKMDITSYILHHSLFLYNSKSEELLSSKDNEITGANGLIQNVHEIYIDAGTYYIMIDGYDRSMYYWEDNKNSGKYELLISFEPTNSTEVEPNNTFEQPNTLELGQWNRGAMTVEDSIDTYTFELDSPKNLVVHMKSYMEHYSIKIYDAIGTEIFSTVNNEWNVNLKYREDKHNITLGAGKYYVQVDGYNRDLYSYEKYKFTGKYEMFIGNKISGDEDDGVDYSALEEALSTTDEMYLNLAEAINNGKLLLSVGAEQQQVDEATKAINDAAQVITDYINGKFADINSDGDINATDATLILQYFAKIITEFPKADA